jgi:hypothetical protein
VTGAVARVVASVVERAVDRVRVDAVAVEVVVVVTAMGHNFHFACFPCFHWMAVGSLGCRWRWWFDNEVVSNSSCEGERGCGHGGGGCGCRRSNGS